MEQIDEMLNKYGFSYFCQMPSEKAKIWGNVDNGIGFKLWEDNYFELFFLIDHTTFHLTSGKIEYTQEKFVDNYHKFRRVTRWYNERWDRFCENWGK